MNILRIVLWVLVSIATIATAIRVSRSNSPKSDEPSEYETTDLNG
jgi:hypothetical protein